MTQSGQGHDPQNSAAGPAREGIVLPANGEPWVPDQQAAPPAGQPWGQPWGPGPQAAPAPQQGYGEGPGSYGEASAPQQAQTYGQGYQQPQQPQAHAQGQGQGQQGYGQGPHGFAPEQGQHAQAPQAPQSSPASPAPAPQPQQPQQSQGGQGFPAAPQGQPPVPPLPPSMPQQAPQPQQQNQPPQQAQPPQQTQQQYGQPPQGPSGELVRATPQTGAPLPPAASDAEATALIPPFHEQSGFDQQPGGPGAAPLPPEAGTRPETPDESTTMLRAIKPNQARPQAQPMPQSQPMPGAQGAGDAEATQLIAPVGAAAPPPPPGAPYGVRPGAPGDRATPAEFDGLFRDGPGAPGGPSAPDSTAQLPRFEDPGRPPYGQQGQGYQGHGQQGQGYQGQQFPPGGGYDQQASYDGDGGGRRKLAPAVIVGIVIVALAGAGLGLGWALSGGGDEPAAKKQDAGAGTTKAAKDSEQPKPSADPAEAQAKGLDALLGDSNNSRSSVIGAVNSIKTCSNLGGAAKDLRAAAGQRNDLVKRLQQLPVDKIPNHAQLTAMLTKAWQSSAAADNHYAAWAGQVGSKKGCHKGKARPSRQAAQGNAASGQATTAKKQAAQIWNPLAKKYGLSERRPEQL
ncbi:hypothetical protein SAMN05428945_0929 [Streptomyces sp. 2224.1]|uniref:hypothetical protein n=1 Tax=Streptomyces sp. 2224.1 TaxID=1881020 RepID=UPI00089BD063|nr:hypothetical protein [Streptomyces sp. 2224.1]SEB70746.1 hypothetical protein SAMN05428945_0929 [Streptomyces sp. 2224.1]